MDDLERQGIGVVDADLIRRELVLDKLVFDAFVGERPRGIETERLEVARQHLHGGDAAFLDRGDELSAIGEGKVDAAPEAEPLRIGEVLDRGRARRRDIEDAGVGQGVLQAKTGLTLLGGRLVASCRLAAGGVGHRMGFVEHDDAIEVPPKPIDDLLNPARLALALLRADGRVGGEEDPLLEPDWRALPESRERRDQKPLLAERRPVALGILEQFIRLRHPDGAATATQPIVEQHAGDLAALARAGAIAKEPTAAEAHRILGVVRRRGDEVIGRIDRPRAVEMARMGVARIDDAFELGIGEEAVGNDIGGNYRPIARLRRRHRGHGRRLDEQGRMRPSVRNPNRLEDIALVDRVRQRSAVDRLPIDGLVFEFDRRRLSDARGRGGRAWRSRTLRNGRGSAKSAGPGIDVGATGARAGTSLSTHSSRVATSGAVARGAGNLDGSSAGTLSITVSRVSIVVPCGA